MVCYRKKVVAWKKKGSKGTKPEIPEYIGRCFMEIAERLSHRPNFVNYIFRDEMVGDGVTNCVQFIDNFDPAKSTNPFAYFTQMIYYAFLRRIKGEKDELMAKFEYMEDKILHSTEQLKFGSDYTEQNRLEFMESFNKSKEEKKAKMKKAK